MSKIFHAIFVIVSIVFIIMAIINVVAVLQSDINLSVEESTLPSCIENTDDLIQSLSLRYFWEMMLWICLGAWHFIQFLDEVLE